MKKFRSPLACALIALSALVHTAQADSAAPVSFRPFGTTAEGQKVELYSLRNKSGMRVDLMTYGATVVDLYTPDRTGKLSDVALGFGSFKPYLTKSPYFGAIVGRYGNRIASGRFTLEGIAYQLPKNEAPAHVNHLHGGVKGFDKRVWNAEVLKSAEPSVRFTLRSPDGQEGYPGALSASVTYTLTDKNELRLSYRATTDKPTVLNLTNHTYFNLAGAGSGTILNQQVKLYAGHFTPVNSVLVPTGEIKSVEGTAMDFRKPTPIGLRIKAVRGNPIGYDHNYVLSKCPFKCMTIAAEVRDPKTGRLMTVYTDQPGIQFYSGNFLDGTIIGKGGKVYKQYSGFCLETQHFPDSPNEPKFPSTELKPGQTYSATTVYKFSAQ